MTFTSNSYILEIRYRDKYNIYQRSTISANQAFQKDYDTSAMDFFSRLLSKTSFCKYTVFQVIHIGKLIKSTCNSVPQFTPCIFAMLINSVLAREQNTFALNIYLFNEFYDLPKLIIISKRNGIHF